MPNVRWAILELIPSSTRGSAAAVIGGLRVSELVGLTWTDMLVLDGGKVRLNVLGQKVPGAAVSS
jgi:hypothetical protein